MNHWVQQHLICNVMTIDPNYNLSTSQNATNGPAVRRSGPRARQDILQTSILAALASDKHMPGLEPGGEGNTTDAIQSTSSLLHEPAEDTSEKEHTSRAEIQAFTWHHTELHRQV